MRLLLTLAAAAALFAQTPRPVMGTVTAIDGAAWEMEIRPDSGAAVRVKFSTATTAQRIAPGEKDLSKAQTISVADIKSGDRVLASFVAGMAEARRIVVMAPDEIAQRNEAARLDWQKRGITGIVASKKSGEITLRLRSMMGQSLATVGITEKTAFKRYAPDSVKFSDARPSSLAEVTPGDQLRAKGTKSADGLKVEAEEIVFGTFLTRAGTVAAVDAEARRITVKDAANKKTFTVLLAADSQLKKMPDFGGMGAGTGMGMRGPGGGPGGAGGFRGPGAGGGPPDFSQMLERMPAASLAELQVGETIVVSSTKGAKPDELTAIMLLGNAGMLVEMAARQAAGGPAPSLGGLGSGAFEMPGMLP